MVQCQPYVYVERCSGLVKLAEIQYARTREWEDGRAVSESRLISYKPIRKTRKPFLENTEIKYPPMGIGKSNRIKPAMPGMLSPKILISRKSYILDCSSQ